MPRAVVLSSTVVWYDEHGNRHAADQGAEVELPSDEFKRLGSGVAKVASKEPSAPEKK